MTKEEFANKLKELRIRCKKTQKEIAEILGRTQQVVGHWETGYSQPDAETFLLLCDIYKVDNILEEFNGRDNSIKNNLIIPEEDIPIIKKFLKLNDRNKIKIEGGIDTYLKEHIILSSYKSETDAIEEISNFEEQIAENLVKSKRET